MENIIRPAILQREDLEEEGREGYQHHEMIPRATPQLTSEALSDTPREAVLEALRADVNLLSGIGDASPALHFFKAAGLSEIEQEVSRLLFGEEGLAERVRRFLKWGEPRELEDGKTAKLNGTVASYLLALSDPQEYAFCKTRRAYPPTTSLLEPPAWRRLRRALLNGPHDVRRKPIRSTCY